MRKKDGYILAYVMFVLVFLCLVVVVVCSSALDNLTAQNAAVDRMEQRLKAESEVERIIAKIETAAVQPLSEGEEPTKWETPEAAILEVQKTFSSIVTATGVTVDNVGWRRTENTEECIVTLSTVAQGVQVDATVVFYVEITLASHPYTVEITKDKLDGSGNPVLAGDGNTIKETVQVTEYEYSGKITKVTSGYHSYAIQYTDSEGGGAE